MEDLFDFGDGCGPVPAHRHVNPAVFNGVSRPVGELGGWVANTACVSRGALVTAQALVGGRAHVADGCAVTKCGKVLGSAYVTGGSRVGGHATVSGKAVVDRFSEVRGDAVVTDNAKVGGRSHIYGNAYVGGDVTVRAAAMVNRGRYTGKQHLSRSTLQAGPSYVAGNLASLANGTALPDGEIVPGTNDKGGSDETH